MLAETLRLWSELEDESGEQLLARTGVVNHGPDPQQGAMHAALNSAGLRAGFLPTAEAGERRAKASRPGGTEWGLSWTRTIGRSSPPRTTTSSWTVSAR
ncbi:hypothetical protein [Arthrobacter sp. ISL-28]|uniref:hypothetical protein n=1 Tax=Arthrobacter sp. ISL-28 TaxID=2819108 RepID=UPI002034C5A1|nr:hypothetical protein [Arthrobacter sp. ISL-28]